MLTGTHHVSALSNDIVTTHGFYTEVLGLRPVIRTVNQDEPTMYHLFFGDGAGSPGSDITVFDMPSAAQERRGNNSFALTTFRVAGEQALEYWAARLTEYRFPHGGITQRAGRATLEFDDPAGIQLALVDDGGRGVAHPWPESPVPAEFQLRGLGYAVAVVPLLGWTDQFLTQGLGLTREQAYTLTDAYGTRTLETHIYRMDGAGPEAELHVIVDRELARARYGSGGVHHVALRVPEPADMAGWAGRLHDAGFRNSGVVDRHYFRSIYVRETNGLLFELASDGPGFEVDGPLDGERLSLPPFLEPARAEIEAALKPIT